MFGQVKGYAKKASPVSKDIAIDVIKYHDKIFTPTFSRGNSIVERKKGLAYIKKYLEYKEVLTNPALHTAMKIKDAKAFFNDVDAMAEFGIKIDPELLLRASLELPKARALKIQLTIESDSVAKMVDSYLKSTVTKDNKVEKELDRKISSVEAATKSLSSNVSSLNENHAEKATRWFHYLLGPLYPVLDSMVTLAIYCNHLFYEYYSSQGCLCVTNSCL